MGDALGSLASSRLLAELAMVVGAALDAVIKTAWL
jgi:hypothetical protein